MHDEAVWQKVGEGDRLAARGIEVGHIFQLRTKYSEALRAVFLDEKGHAIDNNIYIPAYIRRYPFLLAKLRPESDELSLCFDSSSGAIGDFEDGEPLFDGDQPAEANERPRLAVREVMDHHNFLLVNFGVVALAGVIAGSLVYAIATRSFRIEWFASGGDFARQP